MRTLILCIAFCSFYYTVNGQVIAFPDSNGLWSIHGYTSSGSFGYSYTSVYYVGSDSLFNGRTYRKIIATPDTTARRGYVYALLREDTKSRKVYCISYRDTIEHLLYDFSLAVGESALIELALFGLGSNVVVTVDQIDSIIIDGTYRKRLRLDTGYSGMYEYWIEGIGSTHGLLDAGISAYSVTDVAYPYLQCYQEEGITLYRHEYAEKCFLFRPNGLAEVSMDNTLSIFPNPTDAVVTIDDLAGIEQINVHDILGRLVWNQEFGSKSVRVDLSIHPAGVYFFTIVTRNKVVVRKIVKYGL